MSVKPIPPKNDSRSDRRFRKSYRLKKPQEFQRVYSRRISVSDAVLIVYAFPNECGGSRLGLSVSRKIGGAVVRNRWKRLIREAFRGVRGMMAGHLDIIVLPKRGVDVPTFSVLKRSLGALLKRLEKRISRDHAHERITTDP